MHAWPLSAFALIAISTAASSQMRGDLRDAIINSRNVIANNWSIIAPNESADDATKIINDMQNKTMTELYIAKNADDTTVCQVIRCYSISPNKVIKLADTV